ncbi:MAG: glycine dehydrogenase, partial [Anaerolineales bacterium]
FFQEFVVRCPRPVAEINQALYDDYDVIGGYDLGQDYPELADCMLVCVTEMNDRDQIDLLVDALRELGE